MRQRTISEPCQQCGRTVVYRTDCIFREGVTPLLCVVASECEPVVGWSVRRDEDGKHWFAAVVFCSAECVAKHAPDPALCDHKFVDDKRCLKCRAHASDLALLDVPTPCTVQQACHALAILKRCGEPTTIEGQRRAAELRSVVDVDFPKNGGPS